MFGLIGITLIVINSEIKIKNLKYLIYLVIFICSLAVWGFQSRGTIICYFCSTLFVLVFFENKKILHKVFFYLLAPVIIFYMSTYLAQMAYKNNIVFKNLELVEETRKNLPKTEAEKNSLNEKNIIILNRFEQHGLQTSGRFEIWEYALKIMINLKYLAMVFKETDLFYKTNIRIMEIILLIYYFMLLYLGDIFQL